MCRGSIAETVAVCGIELVTKKDSDCIRQALQENEKFESEYAKNAKPSLSGKNIDEAMEANPIEVKSKALEPGTPTNTRKYSSGTRKPSKERKKLGKH
ncbi:hypothetical protein JTB14_003679 [Gonioctena quinquepunctata]|nr:hypothetical protein JTB14_003679 [Gonioctena quinquepunctata]